MFNDRKDRLVALAASAAIPTAFGYRFFASAGGLISYGARPSELTRQRGVYTGRIAADDLHADRQPAGSWPIGMDDPLAGECLAARRPTC
jgi:hypothetical protein